jgi:hypothetical protein
MSRPGGADAAKLSAVQDAITGGARPQIRPCRASWLTRGGQIEDTRFLIPAHPLFEAAFCGFSRGTLVDTPNGPTAIEDLLPGDMVLTSDGMPQPIAWIGATTLVPTTPDSSNRAVPLYRVMPDAFGMSRPLSHMVVGPSARILGQYGQILTPLARFEDGVNIAPLSPPSPVDMFHICLKDHALIRMGGLAFESYHPGMDALSDAGPAMRDLFMRLFPHLDTIADFGLMAHPREAETIDDATAA